MKIDYQSFTDEQLNEVLTAAMGATVNAMVAENVISPEFAQQWGETHACMQAKKGGWMKDWLAKFFPDLAADHAAIIIVRPIHTRDTHK